MLRYTALPAATRASPSSADRPWLPSRPRRAGVCHKVDGYGVGDGTRHGVGLAHLVCGGRNGGFNLVLSIMHASLGFGDAARKATVSQNHEDMLPTPALTDRFKVGTCLSACSRARGGTPASNLWHTWYSMRRVCAVALYDKKTNMHKKPHEGAPMKLQQLIYAVKVAECGNITEPRAACLSRSRPSPPLSVSSRPRWGHHL